MEQLLRRVSASYRIRLFIILLASFNCSAGCANTYDFIIVGGGTAGLVVARRLVETQKFTVLVIEAGGLPKNGSEIPALATRFFPDSDVTYSYKSTPQEHTGLISGGIVSIIAGKMLGGTSSLNHMWFNRGSPHDYDNWANITEDESWNYSNMLKYFKRSETYVGEFQSDQHGYEGPITVSQPRYAPGLKHWLKAGKGLGYSVKDPNGPQRVSFAPVEYSKQFGRRASSFTGYITPILNSNPNLCILTNTIGLQIVFEGIRAVGVRVRSNEPVLRNLLQDVYFRATKEVIVSSGAYGSPLLLQRSGIGPKHILEGAGIQVVKVLPTGLNFQAHPAIPFNFFINDSSVVFDQERDLTPKSLDYFNRAGEGPYTSGMGATGQAFIASSVAKSEGHNEWADVQLAMSHSTTPYVGLPDEYLDNSTMLPGDVPVSVSIFLMRPKSSGSVGIDKLDPYEGMPVIDLQYFTDGRDMRIVLDGIKEIFRVFEGTEVYKKLGARYRPVNVEACNGLPERSEQYWICYIKHFSQSACHPAGTCSMGKGPEDPTAVVDSKLRVIGIEGLRVVDASIMPSVTNGNLQAACYAIAEKASCMILEEWG